MNNDLINLEDILQWIIKYENEVLLSKDKQTKYSYENAHIKFLNGECESLVCILYGFTNFHKSCYMYEISNEQKIFHYCLKFKDEFYDINGKFSDIKELAYSSKLFKRKENNFKNNNKPIIIKNKKKEQTCQMKKN